MNTLQIDTVTAEADERIADSHFYFRGRFTLPTAGRVTVKVLATSWFESWLDGEWLAEGPARFDRAHPEYETVVLDLDSGEHVLAMHVHYDGVRTRLIAENIPLFVFASVEADGPPVAVEWRYLPLEEAYRRTNQRIDIVLGWIEWCQTEKLPQGWRKSGFDDSVWPDAVPSVLDVADFQPLDIGRIRHVRQNPMMIGEGWLDRMGVSENDPATAFMERQLSGNKKLAQGRWMRFDLGKIRLGRAAIALDVPAGTMVETVYAESLDKGRVSPRIAACVGDLHTCNLDHFIARGGKQTLKPLHPRGGRFLEVHVSGALDAIQDVEVVFEERIYYGEQIEGAFSCNDELLDRIWAVGVETLRSCSEDAITDNPTRERGQWLGDAVGAGLDILAASYSDMRPLRRGLLQAAQCAREDGMIPAIYPGTVEFLTSFAIQWIHAIPHYFELTGDRGVLKALYPVAVKNLRCFDADLSEDGLCMNSTRWNFIDWGYRGSSSSALGDQHAEMDPALSFFYLKALRALVRWATLLGKADDAAQWEREEADFLLKMQVFIKHVDGQVSEWEKIGYHSAALALDSGLLESPQSRAACVDYIKDHMLSCFPNSSSAPRLHDPTVEDTMLITPFFAHHVFPALIDAGEMDFALEQFRVCWGWALNEGLTTWPEVFETSWSHCHQWSGCPTWILSRYVLGLHPRFDLGDNHYLLNMETGGLDSAEGVVPIPYSDDSVAVTWRKTNEGIRYRLETTTPIWLHLPGGDTPVQVVSEYQVLLGK